jgi:membrane protease YdiL (CAAX protease family)
MSTDSDPVLPDDPRITDRMPEEPYLAEPANGGDEVFTAGVAEPPQQALPSRRRADFPWRQGLPQPGFWWALFACIFLLGMAQLAVPLGVWLTIVLVQAIRLGGVGEGFAWEEANRYSPELLIPVQMSGHIVIFAMALVALRVVAGPSWPRQVAIRRPALGHVLLAIVGAPAFWLLSGGLQLVASNVLPPTGDLPSYVVVGTLLMLIVAGCWLLVRLITGRDWVREMAALPVRQQIVLGPLALLLLLPLTAQLYRFVSPHIFRLALLDSRMFDQAIEALLSIPWWAGVLVIAVTPAFSEEYWCRAFLGRGLVGRHGYVMGIIWTSLFFGAIHVFPHQGAMAAILGIVIYYAYVTSRSMLIPMLMHFLNNSLGVLSYKFLADLSPRLHAVETDPQQIPWVWLGAALLLAAAVLWAFFASRARLVRVDGSGEPPWQPPFAGVAYPPPGSGTAVVRPWPGVWPTLAVIVGIIFLAGALYWF